MLKIKRYEYWKQTYSDALPFCRKTHDGGDNAYHTSDCRNDGHLQRVPCAQCHDSPNGSMRVVKKNLKNTRRLLQFLGQPNNFAEQVDTQTDSNCESKELQTADAHPIITTNILASPQPRRYKRQMIPLYTDQDHESNKPCNGSICKGDPVHKHIIKLPSTYQGDYQDCHDLYTYQDLVTRG